MNNERDIGVVRGAKFFHQAGAVMFTFGVDSNNVLGPRIATDTDKRDFPGEWAAFDAIRNRPQLDHDGDGRPGGAHAPVGSHPITERLAEAEMQTFKEMAAPVDPVKRKGGRPRKTPI
jgi:hypothetical protein